MEVCQRLTIRGMINYCGCCAKHKPAAATTIPPKHALRISRICPRAIASKCAGYAAASTMTSNIRASARLVRVRLSEKNGRPPKHGATGMRRNAVGHFRRHYFKGKVSVVNKSGIPMLALALVGKLCCDCPGICPLLAASIADCRAMYQVGATISQSALPGFATRKHPRLTSKPGSCKSSRLAP